MRVAGWLALPVLALLVIAAIVAGGWARSNPGVLDAVPVARASPGADLLVGPADPVTQPEAYANWVGERLDAYWQRAFPTLGRAYTPPRLDLFDEGISIPCFPLMAFEDGAPFYCYLDDTIYMPVPYVADLARATGPQGRMAVAYVLAHEYAHHVQHLTGLGATVEEQSAARGTAMQRATIRYELQADCLAGVWASTVVPLGALDAAAMARAEDAAALIRDPRGVSIDSHGSLLQRTEAFWSGYSSARTKRCDAW